MKKILFLLMALAMTAATPAVAQSSALSKQLQKEYKSKMKSLKKEGWQLFGTSRSMEVALMKHYEALDGGSQEIVGTFRGKSRNVLATGALASASQRYAQLAEAQVKGALKSDLAGDGEDVDNEIDKFSASFLTKLQAELKHTLRPSFSVIRTGADGVSEVEAYYLINDADALKAREAALEAAKKETPVSERIIERSAVIVRHSVVVE